MADDIVTELRKFAEAGRLPWGEGGDDWELLSADVLDTAADEIERLRAEINDLRLRLVALSIPKDTDRG